MFIDEDGNGDITEQDNFLLEEDRHLTDFIYEHIEILEGFHSILIQTKKNGENIPWQSFEATPFAIYFYSIIGMGWEAYEKEIDRAGEKLPIKQLTDIKNKLQAFFKLTIN